MNSSITGFARSLSRDLRAWSRFGLAGEFDLDTLTDAHCGNAVDTEAGQGIRHRLALRVKDLRLEHDVDDDASHGYSQPEVLNPPLSAGVVSLPGAAVTSTFGYPYPINRS